MEGGAGGREPTVHALLSDVDEFLSYIAIVKTPEVDAIRDRLERSLRAAKDELLAAVARPRPHASEPPTQFVRAHPWIAAAAASLLGALIGVLTGTWGHKAR
ncbi:MAG: hypothetical protein JWN43_1388 [Gammaproteobacteria bacterium]|nr:hypothetical protein [Gammaproteobacteria bacterium]